MVEDWIHYQFYIEGPAGLTGIGMPMIRRGRMTLEELRNAEDVARRSLGMDPFRRDPRFYFTECVVEVRRVVGATLVP